MIDAVVLDIEGTTSSLAYVRDHLFPYSRRFLDDWVARRDAEVAAVVDEVRAMVGRPDAPIADVAAVLRAWIDDDVKAPPLKTLQGLIWQAGFAAGDLTAHVYPDVPGALRLWHTSGIEVHVYSSGSVRAQLEWFSHTPYGDLTPLLSGHFDTRNAGPKHDTSSYRAITAALGVAAERTLFLSDTPAELDAARRAGWCTVQVSRPDDEPVPAPGHRRVADILQVARDTSVPGEPTYA